MRRSTVLSLPLQLVFSGSGHTWIGSSVFVGSWTTVATEVGVADMTVATVTDAAEVVEAGGLGGFFWPLTGFTGSKTVPSGGGLDLRY
jgi:hypothetical protein